LVGVGHFKLAPGSGGLYDTALLAQKAMDRVFGWKTSGWLAAFVIFNGPCTFVIIIVITCCHYLARSTPPHFPLFTLGFSD
jgi:hypothetical protein